MLVSHHLEGSYCFYRVGKTSNLAKRMSILLELLSCLET
jgi:hypothetical protein